MRIIVKKLVSAVIAAAIIAVSIPVFAAQSTVSETRYIPIEGSNYVVDEFNGVPAYYNQYNRNWQCVEYVERYYRQIFDVSVEIGYSEPYVTEGEGEFVVAEVPRPGDVVYWPAFLRNVSYGHVAIVKDYQDGVITLIEQNWRYDGMAAVERQVEWPSSQYYVFTLKGERAEKIRSVLLGIWDLTSGSEEGIQVSEWASESVNEANSSGIFDMSHVEDYTEPITRLAFCTMSAELLNIVYPYSPQYSSVETQLKGITVSEDPNLTREDAAVLIADNMDLGLALDEPLNTDAVLADYSDSYLLDPESREAMATLVKLGVYLGTGDSMLEPDVLATVEQTVTWLMRTYVILRSRMY